MAMRNVARYMSQRLNYFAEDACIMEGEEALRTKIASERKKIQKLREKLRGLSNTNDKPPMVSRLRGFFVSASLGLYVLSLMSSPKKKKEVERLDG